MSSETKKKRRSSLAPNKIKINFDSDVGGGLHKSIDSSIANDERLQILTNSSLKFTVDRLREEGESRGYSDSLETAEIELPAKLDSEEARGLYQTACQHGSFSNTTEMGDPMIDGYVQELNDRTDRYDHERSDWEKLLKEIENRTSTAERTLPNKKTIHESELSERVQALHSEYLYPFTDLAPLYKDIITSCRKHDLLVQQFEESQYTLKRCQEELQEINSKKVTAIHESDVAIHSSPRRMINRVFDMPV